MADIKVTVITIDGEKPEVEVPPDMRADDFVKELVSALKLPVTDAEGNPVVWRLDNKDTGRTLDPSRSIEENNVREGQRLMLFRHMTAGTEQ